tara:strand:- start:255 stop:1967 length:1713 start_codon:yes stop_codon:yes gene_type:complete
MAVTNGWGQGVINNTNGWGKLATNTIGAGSVYENSASGDTALIGTSAAFSYSASSFTQADADPTPTITGTTGGTFSGTTGLVFVSTSTGQIDLSASTIAAHVVTYTVGGVSSNFNLSVTAAPFASTQSFSFDGVNDTFNLGNITALNGTNSGSFSMWLKLDATGILGLFNQYGSGSDRLIYSFIWLAGGRIDIYISGNLAFRVSSNAVISGLSTGEWFNLVITYDGSLATSTDRVKVFINTNELTGNIGGAASSFFSSTSDFIIGHYPSGTYLNGNVDEFAIFTNTLSSSDVSSIYNSGVPNDISSLNPVAWYRMGENANYKSPQWLMPENSNFANSRYSNYSFEFDGVDDFFTISPSISLSGTFTLSAWVKPVSLSANQGNIISSATSNAHKIGISSPSSVQVKLGGIISTITDGGSNNFQIGVWQHILIIRNSSNIVTVFRNGSAFGSPSTANVGTGTYDSIGKFNNSQFLDEQLDEVAIFDTDQSENVANIYNGGVPTTLSGAVAHWRLGEEATFSTNWTIPDQVGSNDGTSSNMTIEDRVGNAPNSDNNAVSFNMTESDRETDVPT